MVFGTGFIAKDETVKLVKMHKNSIVLFIIITYSDDKLQEGCNRLTETFNDIAVAKVT